MVRFRLVIVDCGADDFLVCLVVEVPEFEAECLLLLLADDCKEVDLSGITATLMTSGLTNAELEPTLKDLEKSDPSLHRFWFVSLAFLCTSRCGESEVDWRDDLFDTGIGELAERRDGFLPTWRSVPRLRCRDDGDSTTYASIVEVVETPDQRLFAISSFVLMSLLQPMMLANLSVEGLKGTCLASSSRSRRLLSLCTRVLGLSFVTGPPSFKPGSFGLFDFAEGMSFSIDIVAPKSRAGVC